MMLNDIFFFFLHLAASDERERERWGGQRGALELVPIRERESGGRRAITLILRL